MLPFILPGQTRFYWPVFGYLGAALSGLGGVASPPAYVPTYHFLGF